MAHSGEHAFYVKTVPGTFGQVVLKNAARTKAATKVQAAVNSVHQPAPRTTNVLLLARYEQNCFLLFVQVVHKGVWPKWLG